MKLAKVILVLYVLSVFAVSELFAADALIIDAPASVTLDTNTAITVSGTVTGTGTLACTGSTEVYLSGDWGIATFTQGTSAVYFNDTTVITSTATNNTFYTLIINGSVSMSNSSAVGLVINNALTLTQYASLSLGAGLTHTLPAIPTTIDGTLDLGQSILICNGNLVISSTGIINMPGQSVTYSPQIRMANTKSLEINGQLNTVWSGSNLKPMIISAGPSDRYSFTVNGKIDLNGLVISQTDTNGLTINAAADKTSDLDNVEFYSTAPGGRHLYIGFTGVVYVGNYDNCSFDNSFGAGNNVVCAANAGGSTTLWFTKWQAASTGGGDQYESQGTNTQINWIASDTMLASSLASIVLESTSAITVPGDFNIPVVTCTGASSIYFTGDWGVTTFTAGASTLWFNGATQTVAMGGGTSNFYNLVVDSTDGQTSAASNVVIAAGGTFTVKGNYTIDGGKITLGNNGALAVNVDARFTAINNASVTSANPGTDRFSFTAGGTIDIENCTISSTAGNGLDIQSGATIKAFRNIKFYSHPGGATGRFISVAIPGLSYDFSGCWFDAISTGYNVSATGASSIFRFELNNAGPGAGETRDNDADTYPDDGVADNPVGGAVVQWMQRAGLDMPNSSGIQGYPTVAFDLDTWAYYSTYVTVRDINGANSADRLAVLDMNGNPKNYYYNVLQQYGNIVSSPWWYTENSAHTVYFGTNTGWLFRLTDTGGALSLTSGWPMKVCDEVTSAVISDGVNLYFGGVEASTPKIFGYVISSGSRFVDMVVASRVTATPSWAVDGGATYLFIGSDAPTPLLYRANLSVSTTLVDKQNNGPTNHVRAPTVYWEYSGTVVLFTGDYDGKMHGVDPFSANFDSLSGFPAVPSYGPYSITAMAYVLSLGGPNYRVLYADMGGYLYDRNSDGSLYIPAGGAYPLQLGGGTAIESAPIMGNLGIYVGNNDGKVFVVNESQRAVAKTYSFGAGIKIGDASYDMDNSRLLIPTSTGKVYYLQD